ncbi:hypothetical protein M3P36_08660 [Altererythrobacter sp. KTW20L]|uniref:hypothetical protein n=1 Tax=Altererythrobacter sp. KTW20L TaxID=2942210 RepID=UPI0020BE9C88|nr:hypothetical protein [Altererythrobacter sp. KTW20L]MCL6251111.1 hypothetical protein [Altererythrobacter sp. KTW20L]
MKAEISAITQAEAPPAAYAPVDGVTGDLLATCWQRIEHYIAQRFGSREVVWTLVSCGGEWQPPLGPVTDISDAFRWQYGAWQSATIESGPFGLLLPAGHVQIAASVGTEALDLPASVEKAVQRLAAYLEAESAVPVGARSYRASVGQLSESISADPAHAAKALQNSGAADLLRSYRKAI